jgi:hypothetical protein
MRRLVPLLGLAILVFGAASAPAVSSRGGSLSVTRLVSRGVVILRGLHASTADVPRTGQPRAMPFFSPQPSSGVTTSVSAAFDSLTSSNPGFAGFNGLTGAQSASVNPYDIEPPDQALCVGSGDVVEGVNLALAVYSTRGRLIAGPTSLFTFFHESTSVFPIGDARCYFDTQTQRWFITQLASDLSTFSRVDIAVSQTSDPTRGWNLFSIDTTESGRTGCPCIGDQPLIGADANGFYVSTNEFSLKSLTYVGANIYAMSKVGLESGTTLPPVVDLIEPGLKNQTGSVQPATTPAGLFETANGGTEYLMSSVPVGGGAGVSNQIQVWALSNTKSLTTASPNVTLTQTVLASEPFSMPPAASQQAGPIPLGASVNAASPSPLQTDDYRMQQVVYAHGELWAGLTTSVGSAPQAGIAWFVVRPSGVGASFGATIVNQGYLTVSNLNVFYPSIGVTDSGFGVLAFSLSGPENFPSVGYTTVSDSGPAGKIHIAAAGVAPEDGFTCYAQLGFGPDCRWGDYSAAVGTPAGTVWFAAEYIPNLARDHFVNWGTFIGSLTP